MNLLFFRTVGGVLWDLTRPLLLKALRRPRTALSRKKKKVRRVEP